MSLDELLAVFVTIVLFVFTIGFLINWYRNRTVIVAYKRIGFWLALIWVAFELLTLGHVGSLDPDWVKLAQVFPLGLALD